MWINPKVDWVTNPKNPRAEDFNRIEGNIVFLKNDIETKKGLIVDAVNTKRVSVTTDNTFQEIADVIRTIDLNYRKASGTGVLTQIDTKTVRLTVEGLNFKPARVFVRGNVHAKYGQHQSGGQPSDAVLIYDYGIVDGALRPANKRDLLVIESNISIGNAELSCTVSYQNDGFVITIVGKDSITVITDSGGTQYWHAIE